MIITSSQQIDNLLNPSEVSDLSEFEKMTLRFGAFVCISKGKKFNFLNFLKLLVEDKRAQKIYLELIDVNNLQTAIKMYLNITPNIYKKIFRSSYKKTNP